VIREYDINDYKNKTELTAIKLKTLLYSALRAYRDIRLIEKHKRGLEKIIEASATFLECNTVNEFASCILEHVSGVMGLSEQEIYCAAAVNREENHGANFKLLASTGAKDSTESSTIPDDVSHLFASAHDKKCSFKNNKEFVGYFPTQGGLETMLYVSKSSDLQPSDHQLLEFFSNNIALAYDNLRLREVIRESQKELSYVLGEAVEKRSKETGSHVKRVAHYSYLLAKKYGLSEYEAEIIKLASPLHDIGKISIPDYILNKPGKHDADEWQIMQSHAEQGYEILKSSTNEILAKGAIIAYHHHEKWDGSGYPQRLIGEEIDISGRITAIADVFDALGSDRCYKKAWPLEKVLELLKEEKGKHFDPVLVDLFLANLDDFLAIRDKYPD
jgi:putative nucleotidyltransferase with HDIG domain